MRARMEIITDFSGIPKEALEVRVSGVDENHTEFHLKGKCRHLSDWDYLCILKGNDEKVMRVRELLWDSENETDLKERFGDIQGQDEIDVDANEIDEYLTEFGEVDGYTIYTV